MTTTTNKINAHPMFSQSDLDYLRDKGYTEAEILEIWDRDHDRGADPVDHTKPAPWEVVDLVDFINEK